MWRRKASDLEKELALPYIRNVGLTVSFTHTDTFPLTMKLSQAL